MNKPRITKETLKELRSKLQSEQNELRQDTTGSRSNVVSSNDLKNANRNQIENEQVQSIEDELSL